MDSLTNIVRNDYFVSTVSLFAIAYVGSFAPKLPQSLAVLGDNIVVKFIVFYVIALAITRKFDVALIATLVVLAVVLGVQVYMPNKLGKIERGQEHMSATANFQPQLQSRQAEVTIEKGSFMENEPLNEKWTQQASKSVEGHTLDWPGYESMPTEQPVAPLVEATQGSTEIAAVNETINVPSNGEIVGVTKTDMSNHGTVA
jgi:hypothetical protein